MKVIDAHWDERNLGVKTFEILLSRDDRLEDFLAEEKRLIEREGAQHLVVKIPVNCPRFLYELPRHNYVFLETSFTLSLRKKNYVVPGFLARYEGTLSVNATNQPEDLDRIFREISRGIFDTDRVALDPRFGRDCAGRRYINWIRDLVRQGEPVYEVQIDQDPLGFFVLKGVDATHAQGILTGLYEKYENTGLGVLLMKKLTDTVWSLGYETYIAHVVSNNPKALRSNLIFGSVIDEIAYHYVKTM